MFMPCSFESIVSAVAVIATSSRNNSRIGYGIWLTYTEKDVIILGIGTLTIFNNLSNNNNNDNNQKQSYTWPIPI